MALAIETEQPPLRIDDQGTVRIGGTRVTLETVVHAYQDGSTPEQIVLQYSALALAEVYAVIAYYLRHTAQVDHYLAQSQREADELRATIESNPDMQRIRQRLLARKTAAQGARQA